jgi:hypothetical protein
MLSRRGLKRLRHKLRAANLTVQVLRSHLTAYGTIKERLASELITAKEDHSTQDQMRAMTADALHTALTNTQCKLDRIPRFFRWVFRAL